MVMKVDDRGTLQERLENKIAFEPTSGCWLWLGATNNNGYGQIHVSGKTRLAHRKSYEIHVGEIPDGLTLDHLCRVSLCINPAHLEPVSMRENYLRGIGPIVNGDYYRAKTHCPQKHPYSGDNLYINSKGWRFCRACRKETDRRCRERREAKDTMGILNELRSYGRAKLTDDQVREIRLSPLSSIKIAPNFGVAPSTIRKIRRRDIWAHVS